MMFNEELKSYVNGGFVNASGDKINNLNPSDGKVINIFPENSVNEIDNAISCAREAQKSWEKLPAIERAEHLKKIANKIRDNAEDIANIVVEEQGKIKSLALGEVGAAASYFEYMAEWGRRIEGEIITSDAKNENIFLYRVPMGVVAGILPWNFPFFLIARKVAPALITGNAVVIKPSEETSNNAFIFTKIINDLDIPKGLINFVYGKGETVGKHLSAHAGIDMISFTGSVETGSLIMQEAGKNITKVNLELGGKAPAIVLGDAEINKAVNKIKNARVVNSGQVCNCVERVYVQNNILDEFTDKLKTVMESVNYGNPNNEENIEYGPMINKDGLDKVQGLVQSATEEGAEIITGGKSTKIEDGSYYQPTVIANCKQDMKIIRKETFGPVLPVVSFNDLDEAISYANDCDYGLTSSIFTTNIKTAMRAANEIKFGETMINRENMEMFTAFHAGMRKSGIGGADGKHGMYEYMQTHGVYINYDD